MSDVPAHDQVVSNRYVIHYPNHAPRSEDPHYKDFNHFRAKTRATARCEFGARVNDMTMCAGGLELHHAHIEFALLNGVDLALLEAVYPGVSDPNTVGAWIESAANLVWLCELHHRGIGGVHHATASDYEGEHFVRDMIVKAP